MRIIAGKYKGTTLFITNDKGTRPLKDMVRESIFNLLTHSNKVSFILKKANVLDLYSGTGSFGLECLSREAQKVYFVEKDKNTINTLEKNINKLNLKNKTEVFFNDVFKLVEKENHLNIKFNLIFCDPPYKEEKIYNLIKLIFERDLLKKDGIIIIHRKKGAKDSFPNFFQPIDERNYGVSKIIFGKFIF